MDMLSAHEELEVIEGQPLFQTAIGELISHRQYIDQLREALLQHGAEIPEEEGLRGLAAFRSPFNTDLLMCTMNMLKLLTRAG